MSKIKLPHASGNSMSISAPATNPSGDLELKLPATVGTAGQVLKNSDTAGTLEFGPPPRSYRNLIINGAMQIAQRGTSSTTSLYQTVDRFQHTVGGADEAITTSWHDLTSSDTGPWAKGFRKSWHIQNGNQTSGAGSGDYLELYQYIEDQNISQSGWDYTSSSSKLTISFWVKSSVAQKFYGFLYTNQAAAGDSKMYSYVIDNGSGGDLAANTWTKITHTIPGDSSLTFNNDNTNGLAVGIFPFNGTDTTTSGHSLNTWAAWSTSNKVPDMTSTWWTTNDATFEITGVQLEVGDATEFEHLSYGVELARCQRYYWKVSDGTYRRINGYKRHDSNCHWELQSPVPMRTAPSPTMSDGGTFTNFQSNHSTSQSSPAIGEWNTDTGAGLFTCSSDWSSTHVNIPSWEGYVLELSAEL